MRHYESADAFLALLFVSLSFLVLWLELILGLTIDVDLDFFFKLSTNPLLRDLRIYHLCILQKGE